LSHYSKVPADAGAHDGTFVPESECQEPNDVTFVPETECQEPAEYDAAGVPTEFGGGGSPWAAATATPVAATGTGGFASEQQPVWRAGAAGGSGAGARVVSASSTNKFARAAPAKKAGGGSALAGLFAAQAKRGRESWTVLATSSNKSEPSFPESNGSP